MGTGASSQGHTHGVCAECEANKARECHHHHHHHYRSSRHSSSSKHDSDDKHRWDKDKHSSSSSKHDDDRKEKDSHHRDKDRDKDRDKEKDREREKDRDREREKEREREKDREREKEKEREREKDREREKEREREKDRDREKRDKEKKDKEHKHEKKHKEKEKEKEKEKDAIPGVDTNTLLQVLNNIKTEERVVVVEKHTESGNAQQSTLPDILPDNKLRLSPLISKTKIAEQINTVNQMKDRVKNVFMEYKRLYDLLDIAKAGSIAPAELPLLVECGFCTQQELEVLISSNNNIVDFKALLGFVAYNLLEIKANTSL